LVSIKTYAMGKIVWQETCPYHKTDLKIAFLPTSYNFIIWMQSGKPKYLNREKGVEVNHTQNACDTMGFLAQLNPSFCCCLYDDDDDDCYLFDSHVNLLKITRNWNVKFVGRLSTSWSTLRRMNKKKTLHTQCNSFIVC
jgi:hypothetical protein